MLNENGDWIPDPDKKGITFQALGYEVETRELRACDFGAPTTRKRLYLIARCVGKPITWPKSTHGDPSELFVQVGLKKPIERLLRSSIGPCRHQASSSVNDHLRKTR